MWDHLTWDTCLLTRSVQPGVCDVPATSRGATGLPGVCGGAVSSLWPGHPSPVILGSPESFVHPSSPLEAGRTVFTLGATRWGSS